MPPVALISSTASSAARFIGTPTGSLNDPASPMRTGSPEKLQAQRVRASDATNSLPIDSTMPDWTDRVPDVTFDLHGQTVLEAAASAERFLRALRSRRAHPDSGAGPAPLAQGVGPGGSGLHPGGLG